MTAYRVYSCGPIAIHYERIVEASFRTADESTPFTKCIRFFFFFFNSIFLFHILYSVDSSNVKCESTHSNSRDDYDIAAEILELSKDAFRSITKIQNSLKDFAIKIFHR